MKKYIAEFIGTAVLTLAVIGSIVNGSGFVTILTVGITLALLVATLGAISGAHVNPAVTLGLLSVKKIHWKEALTYIIAQFAGAALALILVRLHEVVLLEIDYAFSWPGLVAEFIGATIFTFGIASIVLAHDSHKAESKAPFVIGGSLTLGATLAAGLGSNAILNPAVAFGIGSFGLAYIIGPILGGIAGVWLFKALR
jgi:glycerol uptake facilitator-like aquaporin